jgi:hypothetical protein
MWPEQDCLRITLPALYGTHCNAGFTTKQALLVEGRRRGGLAARLINAYSHSSKGYSRNTKRRQRFDVLWGNGFATRVAFDRFLARLITKIGRTYGSDGCFGILSKKNTPAFCVTSAGSKNSQRGNALFVLSDLNHAGLRTVAQIEHRRARFVHGPCSDRWNGNRKMQ